MLIIDDNMYKLAKMQESLLNVTNKDKRDHLNSYINVVKDIDNRAFEDLIDIMKDVNKYNQTLEIELSYLETIKKAYDQLLELQMKFKSVCEKHGEMNLELSDLSVLNIDYVENRISAINGYLLNIQNIEKNKQKLEKLNEQLVDEEKKREFLNKKLLIFERKLKDDFFRANIKQVVFGKIEKNDIVSEYEYLGYDITALVEDFELLNNKFKTININLKEITEKYEAVKVCYQNLQSSDGKYIMEEIEKEFYRTKYKYIMLKVLKLLSQEVMDPNLAKAKRDEFIDLIKARNVCLDKLEINNPLDILASVDVYGQLDEIQTLVDSVKNIHSIRKEISELSLRTEEMINQNNDYLISLSDTKELIESKVSFNNFDITTFDDIVVEETKKMLLSNQVVKVRSVSNSFKLNISKQKANGVIERICKLNIKDKIVEEPQKKEYVPELLISPKKAIHNEKEDTKKESIIEISDLSLELQDNISNDLTLEVLEPVEVPTTLDNDTEEKTNKISNNNDEVVGDKVNTNLFETTNPFDEPALFTDRTGNESLIPESKNITLEPVKVTAAQEMISDVSVNADISDNILMMPEIKVNSLKTDMMLSETENSEEMMPDAFWITDTSLVKKETEDEPKELSFEEQINALLAENNNESVIKKR